MTGYSRLDITLERTGQEIRLFPSLMITITYPINQYHKVSHSFIRREIAGIEADEISVVRFSIRSCNTELVDEADKLELKTRVVLGTGIAGLLFGLLGVAFTSPKRLLQSLWLTLRLGWQSDRGVLRHIAYLAEACVLLRWLRDAGVIRAHAHFGTNSTNVAMLCRVLGGPRYSFTIHGPDEFDLVRELAIVEKVERAAFVVMVSFFGKSQLYRWCKQEQWSKIHVVHLLLLEATGQLASGGLQAMRAALQLPVEKLEQMGRAGALLVAQRHDADVEASKLAALFRSSIEPMPNQVAIDPPLEGVGYASAHTARSN